MTKAKKVTHIICKVEKRPEVFLKEENKGQYWRMKSDQPSERSDKDMGEGMESQAESTHGKLYFWLPWKL